ncbi:undecaprenyl/decaprenyl-phosphate alpha-N-acetylglucosaminyl 1-phosphate transferase [Patescibacteria group bacterium]|nr:undecaprenyl/decaprenyl-phosphate alpha-N-acetylglucosaminyl 1-phosphate transferase [Patescibacteria group bacterium]MBU4512648.1 undecaprenyl/decaprenyl-phosphate alpha-N-acetylglucosaminyl 1-phosphate transferase [Patescibacteria group bacterium]MCG2693554.1 undecaprenyl/decaprenyl-phosphate alpha-N-acetylglucosaminyl 1-phosphate transferase [Candidatus Parcubacteria bacterium]
MSTQFLTAFIISILLSFILTFFVLKLAKRLNITKKSERERDVHKKPVPLLGGLAIFLSLVFLIGYYFLFTHQEQQDIINGRYLLGILIGGLFLMIGGFLDDKYGLKPRQQIIWPILAVISVLACGIKVSLITNPFGGFIEIGNWPIIGIVLIFAWLMGMMYTTKFLDGLDGLASGIVMIGALAIYFLSVSNKYWQPQTALYALIFAGVLLGFLLLNFHPAKIFLGEGGSIFLGFALGSLAIISGAKLATTLLVVGVPALDVLWVIIRRKFFEHKPVSVGDSQHLHFRLLKAGFSHKGAVLFLYFIAASFGAASLFLQSKQKLIALLLLAGLMIALGFFLVKSRSKNEIQT